MYFQSGMERVKDNSLYARKEIAAKSDCSERDCKFQFHFKINAKSLEKTASENIFVLTITGDYENPYSATMVGILRLV